MRIGFILYLWCGIALLSSFGVCQNRPDSPFTVQFKQSATISDELGRPVNSRTPYFPVERFIDSSEVLVRVAKEQVSDSMRTNPTYQFLPGNLVLERTIRTRPDTFKLNWFSYYLYKLQEPVLYNYPLNKEVYRFTWIRSFHPPVVILMEKEGSKIRLVTKELTKIPELPNHRYTARNGTVHIADTSAHIPFKINQEKKVSERDYNEFIGLINKLNVLAISPLGLRKSFGFDGSEWILETHRPEGYYFLVRWVPAAYSPLRIIGNYLLDLSDAKTERRY